LLGQEVRCRFSCWFRGFGDVAGVEDFDQGLRGVGGRLAALVLGSLEGDAAQVA
jgi:hypothetical protein